MLNQSMPTSTIIPVLEHPDVRAAVDWLCRAWAFRNGRGLARAARN